MARSLRTRRSGGVSRSPSVDRDAEVVIGEAFDEASRRDPERRRRWVVVVDGSDTQLDLAKAAAVKADAVVTIVVDLIHELEYVWKAAYCFHKEGSKLRVSKGATPTSFSWRLELHIAPAPKCYVIINLLPIGA